MKNIRKIIRMASAALICMSIITVNVSADKSAGTYGAVIYNAPEGLELKASPHAEAESLEVIPEKAYVIIDEVSESWGHVSYNDMEGWVELEYTKVSTACYCETPEKGFITPEYYLVSGSGENGLELRLRPSDESSTYGPVEDGKVILIQAIDGDWAYTVYDGHGGWVRKEYIEEWDFDSYEVKVYDTWGEGIPLKKSADENSNKYGIVPEDTTLVISAVKDGWGQTSYNYVTGWVELKYTIAASACSSEIPTEGYTGDLFYEISGSNGDGLELRTKPTDASTTFGPIPEGTVVHVQAVQNGWAYLCYGGNYGWADMEYLTESTAEAYENAMQDKE